MSDVIKGAKQLLDGVTSGKWRAADSDIIAEDGNRFIATVSEYSGLDEPSEEYANVQLIAAAPELAQALAAERYEYCVQMWMGIKWLSLGQGYGMFSIESRGIWWETRDKAQDFMDKCETEHSLRIVRRRVSPPEVINA